MTDPLDTEQVVSSFECDGAADVVWRVVGASYHERLNDPYHLTLHLATDDMDAEPVQMLGQPAKLTLTRGTATRQVTGVVSEVREGSTHPEMVTTALTVVPAFEALRHRVNTKVFQEKTVPEILEEVLSEGLGAWNRGVDNRLSRTYPTCEYRVQYDESDLGFCERLMEEEGIVYWFELEGDAETMVLADAPSEWGTIETAHGSTVDFLLRESKVGGHEYMREFHGLSRVLPTQVATRHFDWTHSSVPIEGASSETPEGDRPNGASVGPAREVYEEDERPLTLSEYDGSTYGANDVDDQQRLRREAQSWGSFLCEGESTVMGMTVGSIFELANHPRVNLNARYLVTDVTHDLDEKGRSYRNEVECIPENVPFRPTREHRRPRIESILTATVTGPSGEEIHTDSHGRIKVQFHWDRLGAGDDHSSCWIRAMQPWAGAGWGHVFIPRIGMEVSVCFVDGDPDRPLVTGAIYNADKAPPYALPDEKTKSTIKTESSTGGGGFNELRFEDKAGEEEIYVHAQKDENEVVENDHTTRVGNNQTNTVGNDQTQDVGSNQTEHVGANQDMTVDGNRTTHVKGDFSETVDGAETRVVSSGVTETIDAGETRNVTGGMDETIDGDRTQTIVGSSTETITGALDQTVDGGVAITTPASYEITATAGFSLSTPGSVTMIAPAGYQLLAPGGHQTIDVLFSKLGLNHKGNFIFVMNDQVFKAEIVGGVNAAIFGIHIDTFGTKLTTGGHFGSTKGIDLGTSVTKLKTIGAAIRHHALKVVI